MYFLPEFIPLCLNFGIVEIGKTPFYLLCYYKQCSIQSKFTMLLTLTTLDIAGGFTIRIKFTAGCPRISLLQGVLGLVYSRVS